MPLFVIGSVSLFDRIDDVRQRHTQTLANVAAAARDRSRRSGRYEHHELLHNFFTQRFYRMNK